MKIDLNIVIMCVTAVLITSIVINGLLEFIKIKFVGEMTNEEFEKFLEHNEKIENLTKGIDK